MCPINDENHLSEKYDYYLDMCLKDYKHKLSTKYSVENAHGFPFGCGQFLSLLDIEQNVLVTGIFIDSGFYKEVYPLELFLDCHISKFALKGYKDYEIIGRFILQVIYTEEENKMIN